jgi:hypothetical protein
MIEDWGPYTWYMFHTLAYKIKDEYFDDYKEEFCSLLQKVAVNLPCPYCSKHAIQYFRRFNIKTIQNKGEVIDFFYEFHNEVNGRLKKSIYDKEQLNNKYKDSNTIQSINIFINRFNIATNHGMQFHKSLASKHVLSSYQNWISKHIHIFDL